jgi:hypothetical protein
LKNDFDPWCEEDFRRIKPQQRILIQELSLSDSEILHFLPSRRMQGTFSTVSVKTGRAATLGQCPFYPPKQTSVSATTMGSYVVGRWTISRLKVGTRSQRLKRDNQMV